ncbi:MAG: radical SAM protein [Rhodocyclaceae bacterium]|nr:radical SAM protein [Rhodocyclaceae bacterium]
MTAAAEVVLLRVDRAASHHTAHPRHVHPPLALKYIQAQLQTPEAPVPLLDGWLAPFSTEAFVTRALALKPAFAVVHGVTWCLEESIAVGRRLRAAGVVTIAVGQQVAHVGRSPHPLWAAAFDHAVGGEPELAVPALIARLRAGEPAAPGGDAHEVRAPDALVSPAFSEAEMRDYAFPFPLRGQPVKRWAYLLTSWGCPRPCRHCTEIVRRSVGRNLRERSVDRVVDDMLRLRDAGAEFLCLDDDSLPVHRERFLALCDALERRAPGLRWMANARPDELDAERVEAAAAAGAVLFKVGVDSGSARMIEGVGKARDDAAWVAASERAFGLLERAGIGSVALFVVGLPGETLADAERSLALARRLPADYLQVQIYRAYPDVALWAELAPSGRAGAEEYHYARPLSNCSEIPTDTLATLQRRFYRAFYFRPGYVARHARHFWRHYLPRAGHRPASRGPSGPLAYLLGIGRSG